MTLRLYNTLSKQEEDFAPLDQAQSNKTRKAADWRLFFCAQFVVFAADFCNPDAG